jgi:hypothetical protein
MVRQRDLERAGWQFVRIRGGDFYRDPEKSVAPVWAELDRLGIKPGGIDQAAAEPTPPASGERMERQEIEEIVPIVPPVIFAEGNAIEPDAPSSGETAHAGAPHSEAAGAIRRLNGFFGDYVVYSDPAGPDPRTVNVAEVADHLCRIIAVEGPMIAKRAYDVYLRGCGIRRLGPELKSMMNRALSSAIHQGRIVSENEPGKSGIIFSTVRSKESPSVKVRFRGPRTFEEIPPDELRAVGQHISDTMGLKRGTDDHLRAILEYYELKRLTTQVGTRLLEILDGAKGRENLLFAELK